MVLWRGISVPKLRHHGLAQTEPQRKRRAKTLGPDGPRRDTTRHVDHDDKDGQGRLPQGTRSMEATRQ